MNRQDHPNGPIRTLVLLTGPSGVGKSSVCECIRARIPGSIVLSQDTFFGSEVLSNDAALAARYDSMERADHVDWPRVLAAVEEAIAEPGGA
ncbi:hypothetical protein T492DRAFT_550483 [Pavlovales sp. CCMP2436]|nr:hypothetical protein T492DRAFT_550483 [Pavlovales sp. CCMP2436]|mmetsp:Transcript_41563/g.97667  ORF Transcript_41563/g.97667 Transcript_41563/m.97667 type:complete len:92 (+) Transcript_41563:87-362(+)